MTDIFREIEEDLRRDRLSNVWKRHGNALIGLAVVVVLGTAGWRFWSHLEQQKADATGARFRQATELSREGKASEAEAALEALSKDAPTGYRGLARFRLASEIGKRDAEAGAAAFEALANDSSVDDPALRDLARLRAAMLIIDKADPKAIVAKVEGLAKPGNPWRNSARELLGLAALKAGDYEGAGRWFDEIVVDREAPRSLRQRANRYLALVRAGPVTLQPTQ
jgi:hypothetical protein